MLTEFICANLQAVVNSTGLVLDIVGAFFVATEVVNQFQGKKFKVNARAVAGPRADETDEYKGWELKKYWRMKVGLVLLVVGFLLQLLSNWVTMLV